MAQRIKGMTLAMHTTAGAHLSGRWLFGLLCLLSSLIVPAENSARLEIFSTDNDDRLTDEIYNSANGWRKPPGYVNEWRPEKQKQESRVQFGYDSAYEEMRARDNDYSLDRGLGDIDHPQNTQLNISF
jgi:hypothetical protein